MTKTDTVEDPIVAVFPVPGEIDDRDKGRLPPSPVRLLREDAAKAVKSGAFSYDDPTQAEAAKAAREPSTSASKTEITKAVKAAEAAAADELKARDARIAELEADLAKAAKG